MPLVVHRLKGGMMVFVVVEVQAVEMKTFVYSG